MRKNVRVTPFGDWWQVKMEGQNDPVFVASTQKEAGKVGKEIAKKEKMELTICGRNGRIRERDSYGNDPYPPKG